jgi:hypothetical protein
MKSLMNASSSGLGAGLRVKYYIAFVAERLKKKYAAQINKIVLDMVQRLQKSRGAVRICCSRQARPAVYVSG